MNDDDGSRQRRSTARMIALGAAALALPLLWALVGRLVAEALREAVAGAGAWGPVLCVFGSALLIALCAPASLIYMTAGMAFGATWGTLWGALGAVLGSTSAFLIARSALGPRLARRFARSARLERFEQALKERGLWLTLLLRLSVLAPIGPVSYALGSLRTSLRQMLLTSPAVLPAVFTYVYAGELAGSWGLSHARPRAPWEWALLALGLAATLGSAWLLARAARTAHGARGGERAAPATHEKRMATLSGPPDPTLCPPDLTGGDGGPRKVGVEIEFLRVELATACELIVSLFGGRIERLHERAYRVTGSELGKFEVELDSHALGELAKKERRRLPIRAWERFKGAVLGLVARRWTPSEITTEPIAFDRLRELDRLVHALGRAGAAGTDDGLIAVVGVHFNPTAPSDPRRIRDYVRAYSLLHPQLLRVLHIDWMRRAFRFATAYPRAYRRLVLAADYAPDLPALIDDYLHYNPTRNRGLDLLPLFAHLSPERVSAASSDPRIKGRPAFHFRLPNSRVGDPRWCISDEWRGWLEVERLAADPTRLAALCAKEVARLDRSPWGRLQRLLWPPRLTAGEGRE